MVSKICCFLPYLPWEMVANLTFCAYVWTKWTGGFNRQREKNTPQDPFKLSWNWPSILFEVFTWIYFFLAQFVFGGAVGLFGERIGYKLERMFGMLCLCLGLYVRIYIYHIFFTYIIATIIYGSRFAYLCTCLFYWFVIIYCIFHCVAPACQIATKGTV